MQIEDKQMVQIGGIKQYIDVAGDAQNPILLFLHGGPGATLSSIMDYFPKTYQENFLVANWDQRGAGNSYHDDIPKETMNIEQLVLDGMEVVDYLLKKYNKEKLFLLGGSWGSVIGINLAKKIPEKLYAYISSGQLVDFEKSEQISYDFLLTEVKKLKDEEAIRDLERIGRPPYKNLDDLDVHRKWFNGLGFAERNVDSSKIYQEYLTNEEIEQLVKGVQFSGEVLNKDDMAKFEAKNNTEFTIPMYFFIGKYDYLTSWELQKEYCEKIKAPLKRIIWFEDSGHANFIEEPEKFANELVKVKKELL